MEAALGLTQKAEGEAKQRLKQARTAEYFHRIALAEDALRENNIERALSLLDACSAAPNGAAKLWDAADGRLVGETRQSNSGGIMGICYRPDGSAFACSTSSGAVHLYGSRRLNEMAVYKGHRGAATVVVFHPEGHRLYSGGEDGTIKVWDATRGPDGRVTPGRLSLHATTARFLPDGRRIVTAGLDFALQVRDANTGEVLRRLTSVLGDSRDDRQVIAIHPTGDRVALRTSTCRPLEVREVSTGEAVLSLPEVRGNWAVLFTPDGKHLLTADEKGGLAMRDATSGKVARWLNHHKAPILAVAISRDGRWLMSASTDGALVLWDLMRRSSSPNWAPVQKASAWRTG